MAISYTTLKTELTTDPSSFGYAALITSGSDQRLADLLNQIRPAITVRRSDITPQEVLEAVALSDFAANLSVGQGSWFESTTQALLIRLLNDDGTDTRMLTNLVSLFTSNSGTRTRLRAIANRPGSRAEQLFGTNTTISADDIAVALRGT